MNSVFGRLNTHHLSDNSIGNRGGRGATRCKRLAQLAILPAKRFRSCPAFRATVQMRFKHSVVL
jgi:hypothetical protein